MLQDTSIAQIIYIIIFILQSTIGLLNNFLALKTFIRQRIRITVCGVYLIISSSCNLILMLLIYTNIITLLHYDNDIYLQWNCFALAYLCLTLDYIYIWMSVAIIIERLLIECLDFNIFGSRLRAIIVSCCIIFFVGLSNLPEIFAREIIQDLFNHSICSYDAKKNYVWYRAEYIISYFHVLIPTIAHFISIICILTSIARRKIFIGGYLKLRKSQIYRMWLKQLYIHRNFLISPLSIIICIFPHAIVHYILLSMCMKGGGIVPIRLHIALVLMLSVPAMLTFVIYVYPNEFYLKEFQQTSIYHFFCRKKKNNEQQIPICHMNQFHRTSEVGW
jgi:hypothetical protein